MAIFGKMNKKNGKGRSQDESNMPASTVQIISDQNAISEGAKTDGKDKGTKKVLPTPAQPEKEERNKYYLYMSNLFNTARYITIILFIGLIVIMFTVFSDVFTEENLRYLMKHIDINSSSASEKFGNVYFGDNGKTLFAEYQGDMVLLFPGGIKIYDYRGAVSLSSTNDTLNPRMSVSEKYILVYDRGDSDFYIYNGLSRLSSKKCGGSIIKGYISDSGVFGVMSSSNEYPAIISVYDQNFELISEIKRQSSVTDFAISKDGKYILLSGASIQNAEPLSEICVFDLKSSELLLNEKISGETVLRTVFIASGGEENDDLSDAKGKTGNNSEDTEKNKDTDDDLPLPPDIALLTDKALRTFSNDGNKEYKLKVSDNSVFDISESRLVYSVRRSGEGEGSDLYIVDIKDCSEKMYTGSPEKIIKIRTVGEYDYILTESNVIKIDKNGDGIIYGVQDCSDIVVFENGVMTIEKGKTEFFDF